MHPVCGVEGPHLYLRHASLGVNITYLFVQPHQLLVLGRPFCFTQYVFYSDVRVKRHPVMLLFHEALAVLASVLVRLELASID